MISISISPLKDIISLILKVKGSLKSKNLRQLNRLYLTIYGLLNAIQDKNELFLNELQLCEARNYCLFYLQSALDEIPTIDNLISTIFDTISAEVSDNTIQSLLRAHDRDLYVTLRRFVGAKYQRIHFWKGVLKQITDASVKSSSTIDKVWREDGIKPEIEVIELNMPNIDVFSIEYQHLIYSEFPLTQKKMVTIDAEFVRGQIEHTKNTIKMLNELLIKYGEFMKNNMDITTIL